MCPFDAAHLIPDPEGFGEPEIDFARCRHCGRCQRACPVAAGRPKLDYLPEAEFGAARHPDEAVRQASTSGGAFTALSDVILARGGAVAGADWDSELHVVHRVAETSAERDRLRVSKYVQSETVGCFREVKRLLDAGREVLFCGTPCQVAGLYGFLGEAPPRLITVDFICHGTPSWPLFRSYLDALEERFGARVTEFCFRDKQAGWEPMQSRAVFADGAEYRGDCREDGYFRLFLGACISRPACYRCPYTVPERSSDVTLGDCWKAKGAIPAWDDNRGISTIITNTRRGRELVAAAQFDFQTVPLAVVDQHYLHAPGKAHPDRKLFFRAWRRRGFAWAAARFAGKRPWYRRIRSRIRKIVYWPWRNGEVM